MGSCAAPLPLTRAEDRPAGPEAGEPTPAAPTTRGPRPVAIPTTSLAPAATTAPTAPNVAADMVAAGPWAGLGTWTDRFDYRAVSDAGLGELAARGVKTLYLQTGRSGEKTDVTEPDTIGRVVEKAHDLGMKVVGWYAPNFVHDDVDLRRSLAGAAFRSPRGDAFDGFAPDIEATTLADHAERSARLTRYSEALRAATAGMPLGAIVPSPLGFENHPDYWPGFPWQAIARNYDAVLPMLYWSYRGTGPEWAHDYVAAAYKRLRSDLGSSAIPVHGIGGIADKVDAPDVADFVRASCEAGAVGVSLYDAPTSDDADWVALTARPDACSGRPQP